MELLQRLGCTVICRPSGAPEDHITEATVRRQYAGDPRVASADSATLAGYVALERALEKSRGVMPDPASDLALAADTVVVCSAGILDKPHSEQDARRMLSLLSGRTHRVHTAVVVYNSAGSRTTAIESTDVTFVSLSQEDLDWYCAAEEWRDVAGGYRIQGRAAAFISTITGSPDTVMGLPTAAVYTMIRPFLTGHGNRNLR